ncbi:hypothetical protein OAI32_00155 [Gammaproteobacteria bacterium]|jgi:LPS O-antigen subunit length determinant protein (WzzB/FepE family)|nr:hypothetical protein [Gammaproteobacteria bacterium]
MLSDNKELLTLSDTLSYFWNNKNIFIVVLGIFSISGIFYSLSLANEYESEAIFVDGQAGSGGIADGSALSSLSTLAGIDLPNTKGQSTINEGLERMKSRDFIKAFIAKYGYLQDIVLAEGWNSAENKLIYDYEVFDESAQKWDPAILSWQEDEPYENAYKKLVESFDVKYNFRDRVYSITFRSFSPFFSQEVLLNLISEIDNVQREIDLIDLKNKEQYLTEKLKSTQDVNVSKSVGFLIQSNIRMQMLANTSDYYFFKLVSSPNLPFKKAAPRRAIICILFFVTGFLFTLIIITLRDFFSPKLANRT